LESSRAAQEIGCCPWTLASRWEPGVVSVVRVANRQSLFEMRESERQFQRAFEKAVWQHSIELRLD
jgi:hypothetical protein